MNVKDLEGVGPAQGAKLEAAGVRTTDALLEPGATRKGREELAAATGISPKSILEWVNIVDLYRIGDIGSEFSDLLEAAAVDTIAELASATRRTWPRRSASSTWPATPSAGSRPRRRSRAGSTRRRRCPATSRVEAGGRAYPT